MRRLTVFLLGVASGCQSTSPSGGRDLRCPESIDAYCASHTCIRSVPAGLGIVNAYCNDPTLAGCVSGVANCASANGGDYIEIELDCGPALAAFYQADSGALLLLAALHGDAGCVAGSPLYGQALACFDFGMRCVGKDGGPDASSDAVASVGGGG